MVARASWSCALSSSVDVGIALVTLEMAAPTVDWLAGLKEELTASPVCLLDEGRESERETEPAVVERCGVTASGEGERCDDKSWFDVLPLTEGAPEVPSAGRKMTRIFFSWMVCLAVCSMWLHCNPISPRPRVMCNIMAYDGSDVAEFHIRSHGDGLDEELVTAAGIRRRVLLHGLEEHCKDVITNSPKFAI